MDTTNEWSHIDITSLHTLLREGASISDISRTINRTRSAVIAAARKIIMQQLIYHSPGDVARNYGVLQDDLASIVGGQKYYVPIVTNDHPIPTSVYMITGLIIACGVARFSHVLLHSPLLQ